MEERKPRAVYRNVRMPMDVYEFIKKVAADEGRSFTMAAYRMLRLGVDAYKERLGKIPKIEEKDVL